MPYLLFNSRITCRQDLAKLLPAIKPNALRLVCLGCIQTLSLIDCFFLRSQTTPLCSTMSADNMQKKVIASGRKLWPLFHFDKEAAEIAFFSFSVKETFRLITILFVILQCSYDSSFDDASNNLEFPRKGVSGIA